MLITHILASVRSKWALVVYVLQRSTLIDLVVLGTHGVGVGMGMGIQRQHPHPYPQVTIPTTHGGLPIPTQNPSDATTGKTVSWTTTWQRDGTETMWTLLLHALSRLQGNVVWTALMKITVNNASWGQCDNGPNDETQQWMSERQFNTQVHVRWGMAHWLPRPIPTLNPQ